MRTARLTTRAKTGLVLTAAVLLFPTVRVWAYAVLLLAGAR